VWMIRYDETVLSRLGSGRSRPQSGEKAKPGEMTPDTSVAEKLSRS
jgi:hypothetical protein